MTEVALKGVGLLVIGSVVVTMLVSCLGSSTTPTPPPTAKVAPVSFTTQIPVRDGQNLKAYIRLPAETGSYPVIFIYTCYGAKVYMEAIESKTSDKDILFGPAAKTIFGFVYVDTRGRGENAFEPFTGRAMVGRDGADIVAWIASQPWCNGKVGMYGHSADGLTQYWTAAEHPANLTAIAPSVARMTDSYFRYYPGGVLAEASIAGPEELWPGGFSPMTGHPQMDSWWGQLAAAVTVSAADIDIPAMLITGWWDWNLEFSFSAYEAIKAQGAMGEYTKIVIGPWSHQYVGKLNLGHLTYPEGEEKNKFYIRKFYDYWLRGIQNDLYAELPIYYYQLGDEVWMNSSVWPPRNTKDIKYYLRASSSLSPKAPAGVEEPEQYLFDPKDPSPTVGGLIPGPSKKFSGLVFDGPAYQDDKVIVGRKDFVIYDTPPLEEDLVVQGTPVLKAYIKCDRPDTDVVIRLCDFDPESGKTLLVIPGIKRMRYRSSWTEPSWLEPGSVYQVSIELQQRITYTWKKRHQVRIIISSSNYPRYAVNPNNKNNFVWESGAPLVATIQVYHDTSHPSCLILPVAEKATR